MPLQWYNLWLFWPCDNSFQIARKWRLRFFTCMKLHSGPDSYPDNPRRAPLWSCTKPLRSSSGTSCIRRTFDPGTWERLSKSLGILGKIVKFTRARKGHWSPERELASVPLDRLARWGGVCRCSYNLLEARCSHNLVLLKARCSDIQVRGVQPYMEKIKSLKFNGCPI